MVLIGRILIILVAFFAASAAAGIVLVFSIVFPEWGGARFGFDDGSFHVVATIAFVVIGSFGFLPALIIALVTEALNIRSVLIYATGGFAWSYDRLTRDIAAAGTTDRALLWRLGWTAGGGIEVPLSPNWTAKAEYR